MTTDLSTATLCPPTFPPHFVDDPSSSLPSSPSHIITPPPLNPETASVSQPSLLSDQVPPVGPFPRLADSAPILRPEPRTWRLTAKILATREDVGPGPPPLEVAPPTRQRVAPYISEKLMAAVDRSRLSRAYRKCPTYPYGNTLMSPRFSLDTGTTQGVRIITANFWNLVIFNFFANTWRLVT